MKIFGITIETKEELRAKILNYESSNAILSIQNSNLYQSLTEAEDRLFGVDTKLIALRSSFPFDIGQTVYDIQLRGEDGKYTRTKASRDHSLINEVEVTEANYFKLKKRMLKEDLFFTLDHAKKHLDEICVK